MKIEKDKAMLIDIQYVKANKKEGLPDYLYVIWKDLDTNEKHLQAIPEPMMDIYFEKPEFRNHTYNKDYAYVDQCDKKTVKHKDIIYHIANDMGEAGRNKLNDCFNTKNWRGLQEFMIYPYVFGADIDIRAWYRYRWVKDMHNDRPKPITKGFMDIEVDSMEAIGFPKAEINPIDMVTFIDGSKKDVYTFCLIGVQCPDLPGYEDLPMKEKKAYLQKRNMYAQRNKTQDYYSEHPEECIAAAKKEFDADFPGFEYHVYFYKDESKMIKHIWELVNLLKLDFVGFWNAGFDMNYFIDRCNVLGLDPKEVMCHPDFPNKECYYKKDKINFSIKNKSDYMHLSSYTVIIDQMRNYAAIRKGLSELRSNKLDYIATKELGTGKVKYDKKGYSLKTLSYYEWLTYYLYNIKDVLLQYGIEERTEDVENYYETAYQCFTPYENEFKQTVLLRNVQYESFLSQGLVTGENVSGFLFQEEREKDDGDEDDEEEKDEKFEGALVGNPTLIRNFGMKLFGKIMNNIFRYSVDFDMSSFYPSAIRALNIAASTLIFKVIIQADQYDVRGGKIPFHGITNRQLSIEKDSFQGDIAKEVFDNFQTRKWISTGRKWLNLPGVKEVYKELKKVA